MADADTRLKRSVRAPLPHDSAQAHVSGRAPYVDDVPEPVGMLHLAFGKSAHAHAHILGMDLSPVRAAPGVCSELASTIPVAGRVWSERPAKPVVCRLTPVSRAT